MPALCREPTRVCHALCRATDEDESERKKLLASLSASMNSWNEFDEPRASSEKKSPSNNAAKQNTKRKGKDGKLYLRDGSKRPAGVTKLSKRRMSTRAAAAPSNAEGMAPGQPTRFPVRVEESKSGGPGKKMTTIRGLESLPNEQVREILKGMKTALAVGGRISSDGALELQGAHGELCMLRLQAAGFDDVKLAGGAGGKRGRPPAWNAPKEVRERAAAAKRAASDTKQATAHAERAAARSPGRVAAKMLKQLKLSEQEETAKLRRSDLPKAERQLAKEKLERIQRRLAGAQ